jgi:hypothetical protein
VRSWTPPPSHRAVGRAIVGAAVGEFFFVGATVGLAVGAVGTAVDDQEMVGVAVDGASVNGAAVVGAEELVGAAADGMLTRCRQRLGVAQRPQVRLCAHVLFRHTNVSRTCFMSLTMAQPYTAVRLAHLRDYKRTGTRRKTVNFTAIYCVEHVSNMFRTISI